MSGFVGAGPPPLNDFPPLGSNTPPNSNSHARQVSGATRRNVSGDWRSKPVPAPIAQRDRASTASMAIDNAVGAKSPPKSQYDMPLVIPTPGSYKHLFPDTSHVPCRFFPLGQCQAGNTCAFKHTNERMDAQCKYFLKGNCKFGAKCALLHVMPNGKTLNTHSNNNLSIGSRINPMAHQHQAQGSVLGNSLSAGGYSETFSHQIPSFQTPAFDIPQSPQMDPQLAMSPPAVGLTALDVPMPASFDSEGVSYMARHGPVAASMPGALLGPQSPPASLPKPIASSNARHNTRYDLGTSPDPPYEAPGARMMHSSRVPNTRRMAASLPRHGYEFDPSWEQGEDATFGEEFLPSDLSNLMTKEERSRRLSGKVENTSAIRQNLNGYGNPGDFSSTKVGSPPYGQSPSRFSEYFKQQAETGSPEFQPVGSPLARPSLHPGSSPGLVARQNIEGFSLSSSPWSNTTVSNLSAQLQRTRLGDQNLRPGSYRSNQNPRSVFERVASGGSVTNTIEEDIPEGIFDLEGLEEDDGVTATKHTSATTSKPINIWGNAGLQQQRKIVPAVPNFDKKPIGSRPSNTNGDKH